MIYNSLFFSGTEQNKLEVYHTISTLTPGLYRIQDIVTNQYFNYHQLTRLLREISEDLQEIGVKHWNFMASGGKIEIIEILPTMDFYRAYLLKNSLPFQYILSVINNGAEDIDAFCQRCSTSKSNLARKMRPLSHFMLKFNLKFSQNPINVIGDEYNIRLFLSRTTWIGLRGIHTPFTSIPDFANDLAEFFHELNGYKSRENFEEIRWGATIHALRYERGHVIEVPETFLEFKEQLPIFERMDERIKQNYRNDWEWEKEREGIVFYSMLRHVRRGNNTNFCRQLNCGALAKAHPIWNLSSRLFDYLDGVNLLPNDFNDRQNIMNELVYEAYLLYAVPNSILLPDDLLYELPKESKNLEQVKKLLHKFLDGQKHQLVYHFTASKRELFTMKLLKLYRILIEPTLKKDVQFFVGISMETSNRFRELIIQELKILKCVKVADFSSKQAEMYDLVIHSSGKFKKKHPELPSYFWGIYYGENNLEELLLKVLKLSMNKKNNYMCRV